MILQLSPLTTPHPIPFINSLTRSSCSYSHPAHSHNSRRYGRVGTMSSVLVTIAVSDQSLEVFSFANASVTASEGDTVSFTVMRQPLTAGTTTLRWTAIDTSTGQPASSADLSPVTGTVSFTPGDMTQVFNVLVVQDSVPEPRYLIHCLLQAL